MLTVACVLKSGGIYTPVWVERLQAQVKRHLRPLSYRFVCLSDVDVACERIPLCHDWPSWWSKIELFRMIYGPVLFVDLDTLIIGELRDIAKQCELGPLTMLRDFYRPDGLGSGVMGWNGNFSFVYDKFRAAPDTYMEMFRGGDQSFIEATAGLETVTRWQDQLPGQFVSYKAHDCASGIPQGARIICLHGKPKFADMPPTDEVRRLWEAA